MSEEFVVIPLPPIYDVENIKILKAFYKFYSHDLINTIFKHPYTKYEFLERELKIHRHTARTYLNALADDRNKLLTKLKIGKSNYFINEKLPQVLKNR